MLVAAQNPVILADRACRSQEGMKRIVELAEALNAPVADIGGRMNFPTNHYLCRSLDKRSLVGQADVVLMLEVADPWGQFNTISDPHHEYRRLSKPDVKIVHISLGDTLTKSNYQDMQRFMPVDLAISGDAQATLPALIEAVKSATSMSQRAAISDRATKLREDHRRMKDRVRSEAAPGWDATPCSTARTLGAVVQCSSRTTNGALRFPACNGTKIFGRLPSTIILSAVPAAPVRATARLPPSARRWPTGTRASSRFRSRATAI